MYRGLVYALEDTSSLDPYLVFPTSCMNRKVLFDEFIDSRTSKSVAETLFCIKEFYHKRMTFQEIFE